MPVHHEQEPELRLPARIPPSSHPSEARLQHPTLLLVEDEALVREAATEFLSKAGYRVLSSENGEQALDMLKSGTPRIHLVITDVVLPHMSGPQLAVSVASIEPATKVLLISGYAESAVLHDPPPPTGIHFLQKPFSLHALATKVQEILNEPKRARAASGAAG